MHVTSYRDNFPATAPGLLYPGFSPDMLLYWVWEIRNSTRISSNRPITRDTVFTPRFPL